MERRMLDDYYKWEWSDDEDGWTIIIEGIGKKPCQLTLSQKYNDDECMRVKIGRKYYYLG